MTASLSDFADGPPPREITTWGKVMARKSRFSKATKKKGRFQWRAFGILVLPLVLGGIVVFLACQYFLGGGSEEPEHRHPSNLGMVVSIGDDDHHYHVEVVREKGGLIKLFPLDQDAQRVVQVDAQVLDARVKGETVETVLFMPVPQPGDRPGKTSQFVGKLPGKFSGKSLAVTVAAIAIEGKRFPLEFTAEPLADTDPVAQAKVEKELFLTPGGKYTQADIQANGDQIVSNKYQTATVPHDLRAKPGDRLCPVSRIKARPEFTWVVNGKTYEFCCPPCVYLFIKSAKLQPEIIKDPQDYVKE